MTNRFIVRTGRHAPLGATVRNGGVNFAVFSAHASRLELCLFSSDGLTEVARHPLGGPIDGVFFGFLEGAQAGLVYGFRAHGPYLPAHGHRFNANKILLDPYAKAIEGQYAVLAQNHGYQWGASDGADSFSETDNAAHALKARVLSAAIEPFKTERPRHAQPDLVLYEVHVKGFSKQLPGVPHALRGTYAGLAHAASIAHLKSLGVTTLSLLPVQQALSEPSLIERGASNYWGYNTIGFFCADPRLATQAAQKSPTGVRDEFRSMVDALHAAGLEVVIDVVYNHTPEGNEFGPTLSWRGLDNTSYYRLQRHDRSQCENLTGCGNTLQASHPRVAQFVLDSLRYWVAEMGVDGFRFDLAPVLGRTEHGFDANAAFFAALAQDPVLADVHLISEPWDAGSGGYQVGKFPGRFMDWNDKFRDTIRGYWLQTGVDRAEFARRFAASSDLFDPLHKRPWASVNFVVVHDGFTLADTVSHSTKHNAANGEGNRDGRDGELCANFGVEGPTTDAQIMSTRRRVQRAMLASLLLAQGTPMLCAGDEIGKTQQGNNNAYCLDNEITWLDWASADESLREWVSTLLTLRRTHPLLRWCDWFDDRVDGHASASLTWATPDGDPMHVHDWHDVHQGAFAGVLREPLAREPRFALMFNPHDAPQPFALACERMTLLADSSGELTVGSVLCDHITVPARSLLLAQAIPNALRA